MTQIAGNGLNSPEVFEDFRFEKVYYPDIVVGSFYVLMMQYELESSMKCYSHIGSQVLGVGRDYGGVPQVQVNLLDDGLTLSEATLSFDAEDGEIFEIERSKSPFSLEEIPPDLFRIDGYLLPQDFDPYSEIPELTNSRHD